MSLIKSIQSTDKIFLINGNHYCIVICDSKTPIYALALYNNGVLVSPEIIYRYDLKHSINKIIYDTAGVNSFDFQSLTSQSTTNSSLSFYHSTNKSININKFISSFYTSNYENRKVEFIKKYSNKTLAELSERILCDYNIEFHIRFIEEAIIALFNAIIYDIKDKHLIFYIHIIAYHCIFGLIIMLNELTENQIIELNFIDIKKNLKKFKYENINEVGLRNIISNTDCEWCPNKSSYRYLTFVNKLTESINDPKSKNLIKNLDPSFIPIGHLLGEFPRSIRIKDTLQWDTLDIYHTTPKWVENPIVIGYYLKGPSEMHIHFKIRSPKQSSTETDKRKIERGSECHTKNKLYLQEVLGKLNKVDPKNNIDIKDIPNIANLCKILEYKLIYLELSEREKKTNIKYFYNIWEKQ
jgi:hypothetical protein